MDFSAAEAYAKGRLAGVNYSVASQHNPDAKRPASPYSGAAYLAAVEWERGFNDGFAQGERRKSTARRDIDRRRSVA